MTEKRSSKINKPTKAGSVDCHRCGGSGIYHVYGTCFRCGGQGYDPTERSWVFPADWTDEQIAQWQAAREARNGRNRQRAAERKQAQKDAQWAANVAALPLLGEVAAEIQSLEDGVYSYGTFVADLIFKARSFPLSEKQQAAFTESVTKNRQWAAERAAKEAAEAEIKANVPAWTGGRQTIEGLVQFTKVQHSDFGAVVKLRVVLDDGRGLWVTEPSSISTGEGDRISMSVDVKPSYDDPTFAFGSRPTKAVVVSRAS